MRYLYFTTFVFLFFIGSYSQNYIDFQKNITRAEIAILDSNADYLYPNLSKDGNKLYFASNRKGGKGGFDIYALNKINGVWANTPMAVELVTRFTLNF